MFGTRWNERGAADELSAERRKAPRRRIVEPRAVLQLCIGLSKHQESECRSADQMESFEKRGIGSALLHMACGVLESGAVR
jgi:hypothetical protein